MMQKKQELHKQFLIFVAPDIPIDIGRNRHGKDEDRRYSLNAATQGY
jgi:hypothetical protein